MVPKALPGRIYEVIPGFEDHLAAELVISEPGILQSERNSLCHVPETPAVSPVWHRNIWLEPFRLEFGSISEAAAALRSIQRNWAPCLFTQFRRGALIAKKLPPLPARRRPFPWDIPAVPMGAWTLLDEHTMIASAACSSPFPGE
ncbi:hypothetical protein AGMMS50230_03490 [Spirochaetia bacterium]|nr:hypothetical protein AGMMS50230_03490 [Spirochaetia bacterium]